MDGEEAKGYHKGALEALINERNELSRLLKIVDSFIESHAKALKQKGIDVESFLDELTEKRQKRQKQVQEAQKKAQQKAAQGKEQHRSQQKAPSRNPDKAGSSHDRSGGSMEGNPSQKKQGGKPGERRKHGDKGGRGKQEEVEMEDWWED